MTKEEYAAYYQQCTEIMFNTMKKKNADYCGTNPSPFANFEKVEAMGICKTEIGMLTRMADKFSRLTSFTQTGILEVADETVEDCLLDLASYCILMSGYIKSKKEKP